MQHLIGRGRSPAYLVTGNVVWLARPPGKDRNRSDDDPVASLKQSVRRLAGEMERAGRLKADISAAVEARRYELYKGSASLGAHASGRTLAAAQRQHVGNLLRCIRAIAGAGSHDRAGTSDPVALELATAIRELEVSVKRAHQLSKDMLTECRRL